MQTITSTACAKFWFLLFCVTWMIGLVGCDELPSSSSSASLNVGADVVTDSGRGTYDWKITGQKFDVARPSKFTFVNNLDTELIKTNLRSLKYVESTTSSKPDWMDEDVYRWYRLFTEPHPEALPVMVLKRSEEVGVFTVHRSGTRLLTVGSKIIEWDIETGKRLREFPSPINSCGGVLYDCKGDSVLLQGAESLHRVSLTDGSVLCSWQCPAGEIEGLFAARDADVQAVLTADLELRALSDNFKVEHIYKGEKLVSKFVAVQPQGKWILGISQGKMLRWKLDESGETVDMMKTDTLHPSTNTASAGAKFDRWIDSNAIHEFDGLNETLVETNFQRGTERLRTSLYRFMLINSVPFASVNGTIDESVDGEQDWLVVFSQKGEFDGTVTPMVQDVCLNPLVASVPWPIPVRQFEGLAVDASAECLAFLVGDEIKVYRRRAWVDSEGDITCGQVGQLLAEGRTDQLEKVVAEFHSKPVLRGNRTSEAFYSSLIESIGIVWAQLEEKPASPEIMKAIENWYNQRSQLALVCSACRHIDIGLNARGTGYANSVTDKGWEVLGERIELANAELVEILKSEKPPAWAIENYIQIMKYQNLEYKHANPLLKKYVELYPGETRAFNHMSLWLLPRWGGEQGDSASLVAAVAERLPKPYSEIFYSRAALGMLSFNMSVMEEAGFSKFRAADAVPDMLATGNIRRGDVELLMEMSQGATRPRIVEQLARYHIKHFGLPSPMLYKRMMIDPWFKARGEAFQATPAN